MTIKNVALIVLIVLLIQVVLRIGLSLDFIMQRPLHFIANTLHLYALIFFFGMLYRHAE